MAAIYGTFGDDDLSLGWENDENDTIYGGPEGSDQNAANGNDTLDGAMGYDTLYGGGGNDVLYGGAFFYGAPSVERDQLNGGDGDDRLYGQYNNDILNGDAGNDYLDGGYVFVTGFEGDFYTPDNDQRDWQRHPRQCRRERIKQRLW